MKALVSIAFALEIDDEDDLITIAQSIDKGLRDSIMGRLHDGLIDQGAIELLEIGGAIDWYGASVSIKKPVFDSVGGGE